MHPVLVEICVELENVIKALEGSVPKDSVFSVAHNNWSFPSIDSSELIEPTRELLEDIRLRGGNTLAGNTTRLQSYTSRLTFLRNNTVANLWGNAGLAVSSYQATIEGLRRSVAASLKPLPEVVQVESAAMRRAAVGLRSLESRLSGLSPRYDALESMVRRIESAHDAADQLPADMETLQEARGQMASTVAATKAEFVLAETARKKAQKLEQELSDANNEAKKVLLSCDEAYAAATSQGLAAAFAERSAALENSMVGWVIGLVVALAIGGGCGYLNVSRLIELAKMPNFSAATLALNMTLSVISVAAPVWFAWLATKQIGQRFKLAEDYAFKASVSRAYAGYCKEAKRVDKDLELRLLSSAITRMDEQPLRFVDAENHGSPLQDLLNSNFVIQATKTIPGFAASTVDAAKQALGIREAEKKTPKQAANDPNSNAKQAESREAEGE
jgi:hypothetical protein